MSIAVTVTSGPSRTGILLMTIVSTAMIGVGTISLLQYFAVPVAVAAFASAAVAALAAFHWNVLRKRYDGVTLAISGDGRICIRRSPLAAGASVSGIFDDRESGIVELLPDSTLWPFFLLLRLRQQDKSVTVVPVFLYSLSPQSFRQLSVACRWMVARNEVVRVKS